MSLNVTAVLTVFTDLTGKLINVSDPDLTGSAERDPDRDPDPDSGRPKFSPRKSEK
jgi:hypothetical protein